jgi:hypothetical protein
MMAADTVAYLSIFAVFHKYGYISSSYNVFAWLAALVTLQYRYEIET